MVRKIKVVDIIEPQDPATAIEPETATPETHDITTPTDDVVPVEASVEPHAPPPIALVESADSTPADDPITPKPKKAPRKKKEKGEATAPNPDPTTPPIVEAKPPTPETEHPADEIKISTPPKAKAKPRAKPKAKTVPTQQGYPTHDDEGQRLRPPPSLELPTKPETPEEFWNNTLKDMKEQKDRQYATLIQAAF